MSTSHESRPVLPIDGAWDDSEGPRELLRTLTRTGELLQVGDVVPPIPGIEANDRPYVLHIVNELGTRACNTCVNLVEEFALQHSDIPVYTLTKQDIKKFYADDPSSKKIAQVALQIPQGLAIDLGVALEPGKNADKDFWSGALRRTLAFVNGFDQIIYVQQPDDQNELLDFDQLENAVEIFKNSNFS